MSEHHKALKSELRVRLEAKAVTSATVMRVGKVYHQGGAQSKELLRAQRVLLGKALQRAEKGGQLISLGLYKVQ